MTTQRDPTMREASDSLNSPIGGSTQPEPIKEAKQYPNLSPLSPVNEYYHDLDLDVPSFKGTVFNSAILGLMRPVVGVAALLGTLNPDEAHQWQVIKDAADSAESSPLESPWQHGAGRIADFVGSVLNPISIYTGEAAGAAVGYGASAASKLLPQAVLNASKVPLALGESALAKRFTPMVTEEGAAARVATGGDIAARAAKTFGVVSGITLPMELENHFNTETNRVNLGAAVIGSAANGGVGIALDGIPYLWGVLRGKYAKATGKVLDEVPNSHLDDTLAELHKRGVFTKEEADWYKDYRLNGGNEGEHSPEFVARGSKILLNQGHNVDTAAGKVFHDILTPGDIKNLNISIGDELAANLEKDGTASTDFILGSKFDAMRDNPQSLEGINGVIDYLDSKLKTQPGVAAGLDSTVKKYGTRNWRRLKPFEQEKIYKRMISKDFNPEEMKEPVPDNVSKVIRTEKEVKRLEAENKNYAKYKEKATNVPKQKRYQRYIDRNQKKIDELNTNKPALLKMKEELKSLDEALVKDGKLVKNYKSNINYQRLKSLARVETGARALLYKVNTLAQFEKQAAYRDVLKMISNVMQSNFNNLADPKKVVNYLRARLEDRLPKEYKDKYFLEDVERNAKVPTDYEKVLDETKNVLRQRAPEELNKDFEESAAKAKEFGKSTNVFKNLIDCVMGSLNG